MKIIAIIVVVVVIIAGLVVVFYRPSASTKQTPALSVAPTTTGMYAPAGSNITFYPGLPPNAAFTKIVWNFGNGHSAIVTSGTGQISYAYPYPGSYLVSVIAYNKTGSVSSNSSLLKVTISDPLSPLPGAIYGPIQIMGTSQHGNQTIPIGGWVNLSYQGSTVTPPITIGSQVPTDLSYKITSFTWTFGGVINNISDNNTGLPENINVTFSKPGIYPISLVTTSETSGGLSATGVYTITIAVGNYSVAKTIPKVTVNKNLIVNAEVNPGGFETLDPAIDYEVYGYEILYEIYQPLIYYNGTSTSSYIPVIATRVPTVANGGISNNHLNYTFTINTSLSFSNGDHVTPYDVYVSILRTLLFANNPSDPGWLLAHALLPAPSIYGPFNNSFYWIHHAVTWNNQSETVTFHLLPNTPTWLPNSTALYGGVSYGILNQSFPVQNYGASVNFLQLLAGPPCAYVLDYNWLKQMNAIPSNTSASYSYYSNSSTSPGFIENWNQNLHYNAMGTGPYEISLMEPGSEVVLKVNPYYNATQGMPARSSLIPEIMIEYLSNLATAQEQIESGYAQFATNAFPPDSAQTAVSLIQSKVIAADTVPQVAVQALGFNLDINVTGAKTYDTNLNIPPGFFDNLNVRKAFAYAFNYSYQINVSNYNDGIYFAKSLVGVFPAGIENSPMNLTNPYSYNMTMARYYWNLTPYAHNGTKLYFPIMNFEATPNWDETISVWINALYTMSGGLIVASLQDLPGNTIVSYFSLPVGQNPMPIFVAPWFEDYPDPTDFAAPYLQEGGFFAVPLSLAPNSVYNPVTHPNQWANITKMWTILSEAATETNSTMRTLYYYQADKIAVDEAFYIGEFQPLLPLFYSTALKSSTLADTLNPNVGGSFVVYYPLQYN
ncbi:MAG: ABC transporter substrate-binding protein [Candidatus Micrarchaeaceae archaeon]